MKVYEHSKYCEDIEYIIHYNLPWDMLKNSSMLISGSRGLVGSCLIDAIMFKNIKDGLNCNVYALGRDKEKAKNRFAYCWDDLRFHFISHDVNQSLEDIKVLGIDYVLHLASNTHPVAYSTDPIGTVITNIIGTHNMLEFASEHKAKRFLFASSNEIYGENRGDVELFDEHYSGYIDSNTLRAGYPESKRCGEALCQAYRKQRHLDIVIPRLTRSFGPTMLMNDTKAISQFIKNALAGEDIILKSAGTQYYSYTYVADAVTGLLTVLLRGKDGEAYNIADPKGDITLKDLASIIAKCSGRKVVYDLPESIEKDGFSTATKARLNGEKLERLGWNPAFNIKTGVERTISILSALNS